MKCSVARTALSARLDGEDAGPAGIGLSEHLAACAGCRNWLVAARRLGAAARALAPAPDLTAAVLSRLAADRAVRGGADRAVRVGPGARSGARLVLALRVAVGGFAAVQLLLALPGVLGLAGAHEYHETASFDVALAAGFLFAAFQPALARAYTPVALVLAGCLAITGALDVAAGRAGFAHEVVHLMAVLQAGLLVALARHTPVRTRRPGVVDLPAPRARAAR